MRCDAIPRIGIGAFTGLLHLTLLWHTCRLSYHSIPFYQHKRKKGPLYTQALDWRSGPGVRASTRTQAKRSVVSATRVHGAPPPTLFPPSQAISFLAIILPQPQPAAGVAPRPSGRPHLALAASATQVVPRDSDTSLAQAQGPRCWLRLESLVKVPRHACRPSENGLGHDTCRSQPPFGRPVTQGNRKAWAETARSRSFIHRKK